MAAIPHRVVALVLPQAMLLEVAAPAQIFGHFGQGRYAFELASLKRGQIETTAGVSITARRGLDALEDADTVVIPGLPAPPATSYPGLNTALSRAYLRGARIMSICTGAFVLAEAGLLDGKRAATHWAAASELVARFPKITVEIDAMYVDEGQILTSGGCTTGLDLCLHVLRRDHGAAAAAKAARLSIAAPNREGGQAQFIPPQPFAEDDSPLPGNTGEARAWALANLAEPISPDDLARRVGMSSRTFRRQFGAETGMAPAQWLSGQRMQAAQSLLEGTDMPIAEVARVSGFPSPAALRALFVKRLSTTPTAYRHSFSGREE